jgi:hypothetical protein
MMMGRHTWCGAAIGLAIGIALWCYCGASGKGGIDPWPLLREEATSPVARGPALNAWLEFLHGADTAPGAVEVEPVSSWLSPSPKWVQLYPGDTVCGMRAERGSDDYVTVYDMSKPHVTMLGECRVHAPTPLPLDGLVSQQAGRLAVLSSPESGTISYADVRLSALTPTEADALGRGRMLKLMWDTEGGEVAAVDVTGKPAVRVPFTALPGGRIISREGYLEAGCGGTAYTSDGGRFAYVLPAGARSLRLVVIDMTRGEGGGSWRQSLSADVTPARLKLPDPLSPRDVYVARVWPGQKGPAAVVIVGVTYWPPPEDPYAEDTAHSDELPERLSSREIVVVTPGRTAVLALLMVYEAGDLRLAWRWTGAGWESVAGPRSEWDTQGWILGNGRVVFTLGDALWTTDDSVAR